MDDQTKLRTLFPRASKSFFEANETHARAILQHANSKSHKATTLDRSVPRKEEVLGRVTVRYRLRRVQLLDPDNAAGSTKDCTDGLCRCGLIPGDNPTQIRLIVDQEKVEHYSEERTFIEITYPSK